MYDLKINPQNEGNLIISPLYSIYSYTYAVVICDVTYSYYEKIQIDKVGVYLNYQKNELTFLFLIFQKFGLMPHDLRHYKATHSPLFTSSIYQKKEVTPPKNFLVPCMLQRQVYSRGDQRDGYVLLID